MSGFGNGSKGAQVAGNDRGLDSGLEAAPGFETGVGRPGLNNSRHLAEIAAPTRHLPLETADRIFARTEWTEEGCREWTGNRNNSGYGQLRVEGRMQSVHRLTWILHFGPIPDGLVVMHGCDNPACVEIDHLLLGTQRANVLDRQRKGRGVIPTHQRRRSD